MFTPDPVAKVPTALGMLFPSDWLDSKAKYDDKGRTNRQIQGEVRCTFQISLGFLAKAIIFP